MVRRYESSGATRFNRFAPGVGDGVAAPDRHRDASPTVIKRESSAFAPCEGVGVVNVW
jgi:hypothetical protein